MLTVEAWIQAQEHVDINTLASEDQSCGICTKNYSNATPTTLDAEIKVKDTENTADGSETCLLPIKISCGHIMGSICLLKWLIPYPFGTSPSKYSFQFREE